MGRLERGCGCGANDGRSPRKLEVWRVTLANHPSCLPPTRGALPMGGSGRRRETPAVDAHQTCIYEGYPLHGRRPSGLCHGCSPPRVLADHDWRHWASVDCPQNGLLIKFRQPRYETQVLRTRAPGGTRAGHTGSAAMLCHSEMCSPTADCRHNEPNTPRRRELEVSLRQRGPQGRVPQLASNVLTSPLAAVGNPPGACSLAGQVVT